MNSKRRRQQQPVSREKTSGIPQETPEWLEDVRLQVERDAPLMQTFLRRAIAAVIRLSTLSDDALVDATSASTDIGTLIRALKSPEFLEDLIQAEPLASAFLRGIEAKQQLVAKHGGTLSSEQAGQVIGISRQAIEKRRQAGKLLALWMGRHGYRYPAWQFDESGTLPGLEEVLAALGSHDEWMKTVFFVGRNPRLGDQAPVEMLKAGKLKKVLDAAHAYGEHGSA